jgi:hypothetical protein
MNRQEYHVAVKIDGEHISVSRLLGYAKRHDLPVTQIAFRPVVTDSTTYPIYVYWKSGLLEDSNPARQAAVECAVVTYCGRLFHEEAYPGPVDCCL